MALEDLTGADKFIANLNPANPVGSDDKRDGDNHIRGIKNVLRNTFPNINGAVTGTDEAVNQAVAGVFPSGITTQHVISGGGILTLDGGSDSVPASLGRLVLGFDSGFGKFAVPGFDGDTRLGMPGNQWSFVSSSKTHSAGANRLYRPEQMVGAGGSVLLRAQVGTGFGGGLCIVGGANSNGSSFCELFLLSVRVSGGGGADVSAISIGRAGWGAPPVFTFSADPTGFIKVTQSGGAENIAWASLIGNFSPE